MKMGKTMVPSIKQPVSFVICTIVESLLSPLRVEHILKTHPKRNDDPNIVSLLNGIPTYFQHVPIAWFHQHYPPDFDISMFRWICIFSEVTYYDDVQNLQLLYPYFKFH